MAGPGAGGGAPGSREASGGGGRPAGLASGGAGAGGSEAAALGKAERALRAGGRGGAAVLLARGFRPFFLLAALHAAVAPLVWVAMLRGALVPPPWLHPLAWHGHEMVFGFAAAAVAGFLLTAVPVWTSTPPVRGGALGALVLLWILGRAAPLFAGAVGPAGVALLDLPFLAGVLAAVTPPLLRRASRRNLVFPAVLGGLALANLAVHLEAMGVLPGASGASLRAAVHGVVLLVVVLGGRLVPLFTGRALARAGIAGELRPPPRWDVLTAPAYALFAAGDVLLPGAPAAVLAVPPAALVALRLARAWHPAVWRDPLLASLHLGYAWVPGGIALLAAAHLGAPLSGAAPLHALTAGAMGGMILAMITRVALGHTGRPFRAPAAVVPAYILVHLGALLRVSGPALMPGHTAGVLLASAVLWSAAFALYAAVYLPILTRPRVDGVPD